jgi:DNA-binding MarR family transcriptional regulator
LSRALFVTPANITGIVDRLETKGLVVRQRKPADRRSVVLSLTDQGRTTAGQMPDPVEARLIEGLSRLSEDELGRVEQAMDLIFNIVEAKPDMDDKGLSQS